jgi:hypothetical protein
MERTCAPRRRRPDADASGPAAQLLTKSTDLGVPLTATEAQACGKAPAAERSKALAASMDMVIRKTVRGLSNVASAAGGPY